jgi:uncharacterized lipoprotein YbaY
MRVEVVVHVDPATGTRPADGAEVVVELRDTGRMDAPSITLASARAAMPAVDDPPLVVGLDVDVAHIDPRSVVTVFAQCTANEGRRVAGDWITTDARRVSLDDVDGSLGLVEVILRQIR